MNEDFRHNPGLVRLSDGSGIYGTVSVFHSIHCIKRLRYLLYFDHYHANATEKQKLELRQHGGASGLYWMTDADQIDPIQNTA